MSNTKNIVISCTQLCKTYQIGNSPVEVLKSINLEVKQGEQLAIIGASGSGKSTLLHLLGGLDTPTSGDIRILGNDIKQLNETQRGELRNQSLGFIYQFHHLLPEFTALENVAMPLMICGMRKQATEPMAKEILDKVGLGHRINHLPSELSGGERQRVAVARALITKPACVLADEPTGNLDRNSALSLFNIIQELNQTLQTSFIIVTHDLELAGKMQRQLKLTDGVLQET